MTGASSPGTRSGSSADNPTPLPLVDRSGLSAALARRELALFPRGTNSRLRASVVVEDTPQSSRPWHGYADDHAAKALLALGIDADIFWTEARTQSRTAVRMRRKVWLWMRDNPIADGVYLTLTDIGEATGGYDHTTVLYGINKERKDASSDSTDKRNL